MKIPIWAFISFLDKEKPVRENYVRQVRESFHTRCITDLPSAEFEEYERLYAFYLAGWIDAAARVAADYMRSDGPTRSAYGRKKV